MSELTKTNHVKSINELMAIMCEQIDRLQSPGCNVAKEARRAAATASCTGKVFQGMCMQLRYAKERDGLPAEAIAALPEPSAAEIAAAEEILKRAKKG